MRIGLALAFLWLCGVASAQSTPLVTLLWQDNSDNENGFRVDRAIGSGAFLMIAGSIAANATIYVDLSVVPGTTYSYRVRAFNVAGDSPWSNVTTVSVPAVPTIPAAPSGAGATTAGTLVNVSNRGLITVGDASMIPGFVIQGGPLRVLIRVVGPTIGAAPFNVPGVCADPAFSVRNASNVQVGANDNWAAADAAVMAQVGAFALPAGSKDAALVITLPAGNYTVVTSGVAGATGIAVAEVYSIP